MVGLDESHHVFRNLCSTFKWSTWKDISLQEGCQARGSPLSPLLFVLAADVLQSMINKAKDMGLLHSPIPTSSTSDFPVIQYADDTLIIVEGDTR